VAFTNFVSARTIWVETRAIQSTIGTFLKDKRGLNTSGDTGTSLKEYKIKRDSEDIAKVDKIETD
jgi:hypothetical protein